MNTIGNNIVSALSNNDIRITGFLHVWENLCVVVGTMFEVNQVQA